MSHGNLGDALAKSGQLDDSVAAFREAIRIKPNYAAAHDGLGNAFQRRGQIDEAVSAFREATRIDPTFAGAHNNLGTVLRMKGDVDEAMAEYREAIRLKGDNPEAHCNLGHVLRDMGQFAEALTYLRRGHELGSKKPRWPYSSAQWVKECERLVELDVKLPRVLKGEAHPADIGERLALAQLCQLPCKSLNAAAVRFYTTAFSERPQLADDLQGQFRYNAACAATLVGCGQGKDADQSDEKERARLRRQALDWLRTDLAAYRRLLEKESEKAGSAVRQRMQHWQQDKDFAGVRGPKALARLPEAERQAWQKLWADVADTLARAQGETAPQKKAGEK